MDTQQPIKFSREFTAEVEKYIEIYKKQGKKPTIEGFARRIGTDEQSVWAWATKRKKDEQGNVTDQLARPNFYEAIKKLEALQNESSEEKLTQKQELFCQYYASDKEFFANGTQSYIQAYGLDREKVSDYKNAMSAASDLLRNPKIITRINELLESGGLNDAFVDKQLQFVISQSYDLSSKIAGIREYNKLKARIIDRLDHTTKGDKLPQPIYGGKSIK